MQRIETPQGMTDTQFINRIIQAANGYQNNVPYDVRPDFTGNYNSNSFVSGVLRAAGGGAPALNTGGAFQAPGYDMPIPIPSVPTNTGGASGSWGSRGATGSWGK